MSICPSCRLTLRRAMTTKRTLTTASSILKTPTWSIRSLLPTSSEKTDKISPSQLHHLLRLSALPLPPTPEAETSMITTLENQLQFVRAVQRADTTGVEPLRAIRDESAAAVEETTVGLDALRDVLEREVKVGYYQRAKRVRNKMESEDEKWDALSAAGRTEGRYFVVESGKGNVEGGE